MSSGKQGSIATSALKHKGHLTLGGEGGQSRTGSLIWLTNMLIAFAHCDSSVWKNNLCSTCQQWKKPICMRRASHLKILINELQKAAVCCPKQTKRF